MVHDWGWIGIFLAASSAAYYSHPSGCVWHQQDLRDSFKFERFLAVSRVYTDPATAVASHAEETTVGNGQKKKRKQKKVSTLIYAGF